MILYYTGASIQDAEQLNPDLSLGGHVSSSQVPNDSLSNVFSVASLLSIQNKRREVKMIALKNNEEDDAQSLVFTFSKDDDSICSYKIAFVSPTISDDGNSCFEQIINSAALPYYATFSPVIDGSTFNVAHFDKDAYLGIWLMREYDFDSDDLKNKTCAEWLALLEESDTDPDVLIKNEKEQLSFTLTYSLDSSISNS